MNLLIVENEKEQVQLYLDVIESYNKSNGTKINPIPFYSLSEGKDALASSYYDAAIIDLKLAANSIELEGMEIVHSILANLPIPVFIVSGSIGQVEMEETLLFKMRSRDADFKSILNELINIYNTGITKILGKRGKIDDYLNKIFWEHLSSSLDVWIEDISRSSDDKQKSLLRYILLHIQEYLGLSEDSDFEDYHPAEIYIVPPIKPNVFTGDIVTNNQSGLPFVVLTPACDLAQAKAKDILLVSIENKEIGILNDKVSIIKKGKAESEIINEAQSSLKALISNSYSNKYHFLPKYKNIEAGLINFQKANSYRLAEFNKNFTRIATINSSFTKDIVARFSYYYSRQGSPDLDVDELFNELLQQ
jgi:hypothetical protein